MTRTECIAWLCPLLLVCGYKCVHLNISIGSLLPEFNFLKTGPASPLPLPSCSCFYFKTRSTVGLLCSHVLVQAVECPVAPALLLAAILVHRELQVLLSTMPARDSALNIVGPVFVFGIWLDILWCFMDVLLLPVGILISIHWILLFWRCFRDYFCLETKSGDKSLLCPECICTNRLLDFK